MHLHFILLGMSSMSIFVSFLIWENDYCSSPLLQILETSKAISEQSQKDAIAHRLQEDVVCSFNSICSSMYS